MKDVQNVFDERGIAIQNVGISNVHLPFLIKTREKSFQSVLANIKLTVELPGSYKGTHMSRFIEILSEWSQKPVSGREMACILRETVQRLDAPTAQLDIGFKYFIEKQAPVSKLKSMLDVECLFSARLLESGEVEFTLGVEVPFTSLCPCSKEISAYGAHNQRGVMRVQVRHEAGHFIWLEELVALLEKEASCPIFSLLKREDEKYVTEQAYENPKFVEDILRDLVLVLRKESGVVWFAVECENFESIHNHSAYARHVETVQR